MPAIWSRRQQNKDTEKKRDRDIEVRFALHRKFTALQLLEELVKWKQLMKKIKLVVPLKHHSIDDKNPFWNIFYQKFDLWDNQSFDTRYES